MKRRPFAIVVLIMVVAGGFGWLYRDYSIKTQPRSEMTLQGRSTREWLSEVEIDGGLEPNRALEILVGAGPKVIPDLTETLLSSESIKDLSLRLPNAVVSLDKKASHADSSEVLRLKARAAFVLGVIAYRNPNLPEMEEAIHPLMMGLRSGSPMVRWLSAQGLGAIGARASNAVPALIACTCDDESGLRISAVEAIVRIGAGTPESINAITRALSATNNDVRLVATQALSRLQSLSSSSTSN